MDKELVYGSLKDNLSKIGNNRIRLEINNISERLAEIIKGSVEAQISLDDQEVSFRVHIDYDDRYFSKSLKFDDILQFSFYSFHFVDDFIDEIDDYYLSKIRK